MGLDYWNPKQVVNFRDIGEFVNLISEKEMLPVKRIYRGGTVRYINSASVIENPKTVFNLQKGEDPGFPDIDVYHFPISNDYEKYETAVPEVRAWLRSVVRTVEQGIRYPLYIHCHSGKDRTGVAVAALLLILGIPEPVIIEEYLLSEGEVCETRIRTAIEGMRDLNRYFDGTDLETVRKYLTDERKIW